MRQKPRLTKFELNTYIEILNEIYIYIYNILLICSFAIILILRACACFSDFTDCIFC